MKNTKPSKLEQYLEILKALEHKKASQLAMIRRKTNLDSAFVKQAMSFLEKQNLVEKRTIKNKTVYKNTSRGERINRYFMEQNQGKEFAYVITDDVTYNSQLPITCKPLKVDTKFLIKAKEPLRDRKHHSMAYLFLCIVSFPIF